MPYPYQLIISRIMSKHSNLYMIIASRSLPEYNTTRKFKPRILTFNDRVFSYSRFRLILQSVANCKIIIFVDVSRIVKENYEMQALNHFKESVLNH